MFEADLLAKLIDQAQQVLEPGSLAAQVDPLLLIQPGRVEAGDYLLGGEQRQLAVRAPLAITLTKLSRCLVVQHSKAPSQCGS